MTLAARQKAARCFALAASTTFPAERETAIERGKAICESAGLDLDDFEIPGRTPSKPRATSDIRDKDRASFYRSSASRYRGPQTFAEFEAKMRQFQETMRAQEAAYRNAEEQMKRQREAQKTARASTYFATVGDARKYIEAAGAQVYEDVDDETGATTWAIITDRGIRRGISDSVLVGIAERLMTPEEKRNADTVRYTETMRENLRSSRDDAFFHAFTRGASSPPSDRCPKCGGQRERRGFFSICPSCQ